MKITIRIPEICLGVNVLRGVEVRKGDLKVRHVMDEVLEKVKGKMKLEELKDDPVVRAYRNFYWRIGIDPTKQRPSGEALVRRALRGNVPSINNVVDAGNLASMETLIPIGLYDLDRVKGELELRYAKDGELFLPIGGKEEKLRTNQIVLADEEKVLHVFPHRDSRITMITESTRNVLVVACGVPGVEAENVLDACRKATEYLKKLAGGESGECRIMQGL